MERAAGVGKAVWERRTLAGSGSGSGSEGTTSGASAEFMVIVREWPSDFETVRWAGEVAVVSIAVDGAGLSRFSLDADFCWFGSGSVFGVGGMTTCFSTSEAALGLDSARIWGSIDKGREDGNGLGRNRFKDDREDFPLL